MSLSKFRSPTLLDKQEEVVTKSEEVREGKEKEDAKDKKGKGSRIKRKVKSK